MAKSKVVAKKTTGTALTSWRDRAAKSVVNRKAVSDKLPAGGGSFLSFRGGSISLGEKKFGNKLPAVILATQYERAYYASQFSPGTAATPDCFSYDNVSPHETVETPVSDSCASCPMNQFGSATNQKGKGCKEGVKFALIHADALDDIDSISDTPIVQARASVLNSRIWKEYADGLDEMATWQAITVIGNQPDERSQYKLSFVREMVIGDDELLNALANREAAAIGLLATPYPKMDEQPPAKPASGRARKFK